MKKNRNLYQLGNMGWSARPTKTGAFYIKHSEDRNLLTSLSGACVGQKHDNDAQTYIYIQNAPLCAKGWGNW